MDTVISCSVLNMHVNVSFGACNCMVLYIVVVSAAIVVTVAGITYDDGEWRW